MVSLKGDYMKKAVEQPFNLNNLIKRYRWSVLFILTLSVAIGLIAPKFIKPRYKVTAVISISPRYFQNPLVREFMSEVYDPTELKSQRESMIRQAFDQNFLDEVAKRLKFYREEQTGIEAAYRRQETLKNIEIISLQSSDFQLSFTEFSRESAMEFADMGLKSVLRVLKQQRSQSLTRLRDSIGVQLQTMGSVKTDANHLTADSLKLQIGKLAQEIEKKKGMYSPQHPTLRASIEKMKSLEKQLAFALNNPETQQITLGDLEGGSSLDATKRAVYEDLIRKFSYLNIAIQTENEPKPSYFSIVRSPELPYAPIWPKKSLFLIWSSLLGMLICLLQIALREFSAGRMNVFGKQSPREIFTSKMPAATVKAHFVESKVSHTNESDKES